MINLRLECTNTVLAFKCLGAACRVLAAPFPHELRGCEGFLRFGLRFHGLHELWNSLRNPSAGDMLTSNYLLKESAQPSVRLVLMGDVLYHYCGTSGWSHLLQPSFTSLQKLPLSLEDEFGHGKHHGPNHQSINPIEAAVFSDGGHGHEIQSVLDSGTAVKQVVCLTSKQMVESAHDQNHRQADPLQDPHAQLCELQEHSAVKADALLHLFSCGTQRSIYPAEVTFIVGLWSKTLYHIVLVDQSEPLPQHHEDANAREHHERIGHHSTQQSCKVCSLVLFDPHDLSTLLPSAWLKCWWQAKWP
mmetsp:Transcript_110701/g.196101  ORF Transcript_110701/g.196101 Transcript_110701/m.196101 type:complete len:303 (-) Transcript_110701:294-1202(-)